MLILLWQSLIAGRIFSSGDNIFLFPPFTAEQPAGWVHPSNGDLTDPLTGFLPDVSQARFDLHHGTLPLWNPNVAAGRPLLAQQQSALPFPLTWLALLLPFWQSLAWIAAGKLLLAAAGTYLLCRELELDPGPALLGAIAYPFGTFFMAWLEHPHTNAWAMLPWALFATRRICARGSLGATALLGAAIGLACLGGHPESAGFVLGATLVYAAFELIAERVSGRRAAAANGSFSGPEWSESTGGRAGLVAAGLLLGIGLGAILTAPLAELLGQAYKPQRGGPPAPFSQGLFFFFPELWGNPSKAFEVGADDFNERTAYIGALPLLLAVGALGRRRPREQWFFVGLAVVSLATVFDTPLWASGVRGLPEGNAAALTRLLIIITLCGAVLAAFGLQRWLSAGPREHRRMLMIMGGLAVIPVLVWLPRHLGVLSHLGAALGQLPAVRADEKSLSVAQLGSVWRWVLLCTLGVGGLALAWRRRSTRLAVALAVALSGIDLVTLDYGFHGQIPPSWADPPAPATIQYLQAHQGDWRVMGDDIATPTLPANLAERYGLRDPRAGVMVPYTTRYSNLWLGLGGLGGDQEFFYAGGPRSQRLASIFATRYVLMSPGVRAPSWLHPVFRDPGGTVALNPTALPRAWVAYDWRQASGGHADLAQTLGSSIAQVRDEPVIEGSPPPPKTLVRTYGAAQVTADGPEGVTIRASARRAGYLILDDSAYPGWDAYLDGRSVGWHPANENFRAVAIPAGTHVISFRYRPASVLVGGILTALSALVLAGMAAAGAWRVRSRRR